MTNGSRTRIEVDGGWGGRWMNVVLWPSIVGPWLGLASQLAYHSTSPSQLGDLMSIQTIPFEYGGLWNESFPNFLVRICTVDAVTHRLRPMAR